MKKNRKKSPKMTHFQRVVVGMAKLVLCLVFLATAGTVVAWAFTHDQTNVEAQKVLTEEVKEFDAQVEFQKLHPKADVFKF